MQTPEDWAEEIEGITGHGGPAVEQIIRDAMRAVYDDIIVFIEDEDMGADESVINAICNRLTERMCEQMGEDY